MSETDLTGRGFPRSSGLGVMAMFLGDFKPRGFAEPTEYVLYVGASTSAGAELVAPSLADVRSRRLFSVSKRLA